MNESLGDDAYASQRLHLVTVGQYRIGEVLQRLSCLAPGDVKLQHISASFDDAVDAVRRLQQSGPVDALVAAGASGAWLRERVDIPVAMVEVRGFDLMGALAQARTLSTRVGLVNFEGLSPEVANFEAQFGAGITQFRYKGPDDAQACVQAIQDSGVGAVVAPGLVSQLAEQAGIASVLMYSDAAVEQALRDGLLLAGQRMTERTQHQRLQTILRELPDAVMTVDCQQKIMALNAPMARLLATGIAPLQGQCLADVAAVLNVQRVLQRQESTEQVIQLATRTQVVRISPIWANGQVSGALIVCRDPAVIQRADRNLRASARHGLGPARWRLTDYVGDSPAAQRVRNLAAQYAATDASVLILGESGTGKEMLAQGMHGAGRRSQQPFLAVNCAALSESLLESELFGYEDGAFTGARKGGKSGLIEAAHTGTLFLDEIGDMPLALQSRLLRVLQEREVLRVGATVPVAVDIRVMAATHADLAAQVERGLFRRDLYYRLAVLRLRTPALRERGAGDLWQLALAALHRRLLAQGLVPSEGGVTGDVAVGAEKALQAVLQRAVAHRWLGNVRELDNWVERVLACQDYLLGAGGELSAERLLEVFPECALPAVRGAPEVQTVVPAVAQALQTPSRSLKSARVQAELERLNDVLQAVGGNQERACDILGISRATLWRRMKGAQGQRPT